MECKWANPITRRYKNLKDVERLIYGLIDETGGEGIWSKTLKTKAGVHDSIMKQALKALEARGLIKDLKSVKYPARKMYMRADAMPSQEATGGSWFTDGELDEDFISTLLQVLYQYIESRSFYKSTNVARSKPKVKIEVDEDGHRSSRQTVLLPMPPGYQDYPTLKQLTKFIDDSPVTSETLDASEIQQLLDVLCYDNRIEQITAGTEGVAYKSVKQGANDTEFGSSNGLMEAPCGRCPVFDLCEEGGPVGPGNCEYYQKWLEI